MLLRGRLGEGLPSLRFLTGTATGGVAGVSPRAGRLEKAFAFPFYMPLEEWEALKPGDAMREWRTRTVAKPTIRFRKSAGTSEWHQGCRPFAAFARLRGLGIRAERDLGPGSVRVCRDLGSGTVYEARHPEQRSHPSSGPMDLPDPSACVGSSP